MLSTIKIDVDEDNRPIIVINYQESEDIRDKLVKRFLEKLNGSSFASVKFDSLTAHGSITAITPIPITDLKRHSIEMMDHYKTLTE